MPPQLAGEVRRGVHGGSVVLVMSFRYRTLPSRATGSYSRKVPDKEKPRTEYWSQKRYMNKESALATDGDLECVPLLAPLHQMEQGRLHDVLQILSRRRREREPLNRVLELKNSHQGLEEERSLETLPLSRAYARRVVAVWTRGGETKLREISVNDSVSYGTVSNGESGESLALCRKVKSGTAYCNSRTNDRRAERLPLKNYEAGRGRPVIQPRLKGVKDCGSEDGR